MKKISRFVTFLIFTASFTMPLLAVAQLMPPAQLPSNSTSGGINDTYLKFYKNGIVNTINDILVPVLIAISFIVFLWGVYSYFILGAAEEDKRKEGRQFVLWGIIGFVIIISVWGIVNIVKQTIIPTAGVNSNAPVTPRI